MFLCMGPMFLFIPLKDTAIQTISSKLFCFHLFIVHQNQSCLWTLGGFGAFAPDSVRSSWCKYCGNVFFTVWMLIFIFGQCLHWTVHVPPDPTSLPPDWSDRIDGTASHGTLCKEITGVTLFSLIYQTVCKVLVQLLQYKHIPFTEWRLVCLTIQPQ